MAIEKVCRTITEKTTSVEQPIELTQKGKIKVTYLSTRNACVLPVPTSIKNPKSLVIIPHTLKTSKIFNQGRWITDFVLYSATEASLSRLLIAPATNTVLASLASGSANGDMLITYDGKLYIAPSAGVASSAFTSGATIKTAGTLIQVPFSSATNAKCMLKITYAPATVASFTKEILSYSYEVRGY